MEHSGTAVTGICLLWNDAPGMDAQHSHLNNSGLSRRLDVMPGSSPGYSTSYAERERLHLRQETYCGRRTSQSNLVPAILEPVKRLVSLAKARLKGDTTYYQRQLGRLSVAKPWQWEQAKSQTGYDAQDPLTVPAHAWYCWGFWLEVSRRLRNGDHRYVTASVLARRALRGWRRWTIQEKLLAPTWQQARLNARLPVLPPLPTPTGSGSAERAPTCRQRGNRALL
jgi:hypothetical protein